MRLSRPALFRFATTAFLLGVSACAPNRRAGSGVPRGAQPGGMLSGQAPDLVRVYQSMGLIAPNGQMPFVGNIAFMQGPNADSTLMLVALSLPARVLNFTRDGDQYAATYAVRLELRRGTTVVQQIDAKEVVRVPTFKETSRTDESVIWQQFLRVAPGQYALTVGVKDDNTIRNTSQEVSLTVPLMQPGHLSTPIAVYEAVPRHQADSLPRILARPRSAVNFDSDSLIPIYFEASGISAPTPVRASVMAEGSTIVWRDSVMVNPSSGSVSSRALGIPVKQLGIGVVTLMLTQPGNADTVRTRLFVSLSEDLPVATFEEMLRYLRYFAPFEKLRALRDAPPAARPQAWSEFIRSTDPTPATSENEGLRDYFNRIRVANVRFKDDALIGWQSDRGIAYVGLGEPDNILEGSNMDPLQRGRQQVWEYNGAIRLRLVYTDTNGMGRFRLTTQGMNDLESAIRRKMSIKP